jgi:hypothetical protein
MVIDHCTDPEGQLDSWRIPSHTHAMRLLAKAGFIRKVMLKAGLANVAALRGRVLAAGKTFGMFARHRLVSAARFAGPVDLPDVILKLDVVLKEIKEGFAPLPAAGAGCVCRWKGTLAGGNVMAGAGRSQRGRGWHGARVGRRARTRQVNPVVVYCRETATNLGLLLSD